jgi:hypothetical protein
MTLAMLNSRRNLYDHFITNIGDITPKWEDRKRSDGIVERKLKSITYGDKEYLSTDRFLLSLCSKFGMGTSIFTLFDPGEVFARIQQVHPKANMRVVTEGNTCLAATSPTKSYVDYDILLNILNAPSRAGQIVRATYHNGIVTTVHSMLKEAPWEINGELFYQAFTLETPVDGYGLPAIYLSLVRDSNQTLLTADSKTFKSEVQLGKDAKDKPEIPLKRALDTFNNEEGFQALRQRLASAQTSQGSLHECDSMYKAMCRVIKNNGNNRFIFESYRAMTGDVAEKYGIATEDSLSSKKARLLPMNCTVFDLIGFNMEITSLYRSHIDAHKPLSTWIGQTIDNEYDLEGSLEQEEDTNNPNQFWVQSEELEDDDDVVEGELEIE